MDRRHLADANAAGINGAERRIGDKAHEKDGVPGMQEIHRYRAYRVKIALPASESQSLRVAKMFDTASPGRYRMERLLGGARCPLPSRLIRPSAWRLAVHCL